MADREKEAQDFARMLRSGRKQEANREIVEALHPPPDPQEPEPEPEAEEIMSRLLSPKPGHVELIRQLHPPGEADFGDLGDG